ncbi:DivIVA domain-containing protein [Mycobacterium sp. URHB0044]|uniref:DivIVA domain-containing protein n=1 Tax=Mycobacterium sp. URHB0044 TaxID=1380386 RepID=UPI0026F39C30|nr:DivIVA domain-containing protein [Mycobacterium sp. URHB0044]
MNADHDPEKHIADLERQLAQGHHPARPEREERPEVKPDDVHDLAFSTATTGRRGYHQEEVDAFLDRVEATLRYPAASGGITAADMRNVAFSKPPLGRPGYHEDEVDAFLDLVARQMERRSGQPSAVDRTQKDPPNFSATTGVGLRHLTHSDESTARRILREIYRCWVELGSSHSVVTWRSPLVLGSASVLLGFATHPTCFALAALLFLWAFAAWRSQSG